MNRIAWKKTRPVFSSRRERERTSSVVGKTKLDTILGELVRVGGGKNNITSDLGVDDLGNNVGVGETDDESVLGRVVLVLILDDKALAGIEISLTL
jgi:hypothetical protein